MAQTNTTAPGNWNTPGNWSSGVPGGGTNANVNHAMTINTNIATTSGDYIINQPITDTPGGTAYTLSISGTGGNQGHFDVYANSSFEGALNVNGNGTLTVRSGYTLTVGSAVFANNSTVIVESGATLIINGDLTNNNNSTGITINGTLIVNGDFNGGNGSAVSGSGTMETTGTITTTGSGSVFGSTNDCSTGPCSGNNLCVSNTIGTAQTICAGATPAGLTGSAHGGYSFQWQSSTTSASSGFANVSGATGQNYAPGSLTVTTWYRRIASSGGCNATSSAVQITVNPAVTPSITITRNTGATICAGTSVTFTATPVNGGASPSYQWKLNGSNVGTNSNTFVTTTLTGEPDISCVLTSNAACVSPATTTSNILSMTVTANSWTGTSNANWANAANWCGGIPTAATDVIIPSGTPFAPVISGVVHTKNLTINGAATLSNNASGTLNVHGNFTNNGSYGDNGTTVFTGSTAQSINGNNIFHSFTLNNTAGANMTGINVIKGYLTLTAGNLGTGGNLTIDLNSGTVSGTGNGTTSGNIKFSKYVWGDKYHYISSPISGKTVSDWNDDVTIKFGTSANLYTYNETIVDPDKLVGWEAVSSLATPIQDMKGYALYFTRGVYNHILDVTGAYNHAASFSNSGLTNTLSSDPASDGWNLMGNPYPSVIDWDAASGWNKTGIDNAIYFWDPKNNRYASYVNGIGTNGGTQHIPAMQGFWVKVSNSGSTGTLAMNNNVRVVGPNPDIWRTATEDNILKISTFSGEYKDETVIRLKENASENFDPQVDAYKLNNTGNTPSIYTLSSDAKYSINSIPENTVQKTIPINILAGFEGNYNLSVDITGFADAEYLVLEDRLLEYTQDLRGNAHYKVVLNNGLNEGRFFIAYKKREEFTTGNSYAYASNNAVDISAYMNTISILFPEQNTGLANVGIYNALGQKVLELPNQTIQNGKISVEIPNAQNGIYIVKVNADNKSKAQQVYISR